jgi:hypothetical protein
MRIVQALPLQAQVGFETGGKLGGKADLHGAAVGFLVVECRHHTLTMVHIKFIPRQWISSYPKIMEEPHFDTVQLYRTVSKCVLLYK